MNDARANVDAHMYKRITLKPETATSNKIINDISRAMEGYFDFLIISSWTAKVEHFWASYSAIASSSYSISSPAEPHHHESHTQISGDSYY